MIGRARERQELDASHMGSEYVPEFNDDGSVTLRLMPQAFCYVEK